MQGIKLIWESFVRFMIRYFESKSLRNDQVEYLRMEIEKLKLERNELLNHILHPAAVKTEVEVEDADWQPVTKGYQPWSSKQRQLEEASKQKAMQLAADALTNLNRKKSTEQLESELLTGTD